MRFQASPQAAAAARALLDGSMNPSVVVAEAIIERIAHSEAPTFEGTMKSGFKVMRQWMVGGLDYDEYHAQAWNPSTQMPPEESLDGPKPYDYGLGVEKGHKGHFVSLAPKRLGGRKREKLIRWMKEKGNDRMQELAAKAEAGQNPSIYLHDYPAHPFVQPTIDELKQAGMEALVRIMRQALGAH